MICNDAYPVIIELILAVFFLAVLAWNEINKTVFTASNTAADDADVTLIL